MGKKTILICFLFILLAIIFILFPNSDTYSDNSLYINSNLSNETIEFLLVTDFEENEYITVGQLLLFFNRLSNNNPNNYKEVQEFSYNKHIYLPSDLVYNIKDWENLWRNIVLGKTVFEKVNDNTYSITLIQGYLKIYLNQQGYELMKEGLIPPQLYFYSPFSSVLDLESINLNKKASLGFILEVLMTYNLDSKIDKKELLHSLVVNKVEEMTQIKEENWSTTEVALYNYYSLSYYGQFSYFKSLGLLDDIELNDLNKNISIGEFLILVNKIVQ